MGRWTGDESTEGATTGSDTPDGPLYTSVSDRELIGLSSEQIERLQRRQQTLVTTQTRHQSEAEVRGQQQGEPREQEQRQQQDRQRDPLGGFDDGTVFLAMVVLIALLLVMDGPGGERGGVRG